MKDEFTSNVQNLYGASGIKWLESIPKIIRIYEEKWKFQIKPPFKLTFNYVAPVKFNQGKKAVLKIGYPKDMEFQNEIEALKLFNGKGVVRLIETDKVNAAILIEQVSPGIPLSTIKDDEKSTRILASLMKKIRTLLPENHNFTTIKEWTKELYQYPTFHIKDNIPLIPKEIINIAVRLFEELISTSDKPVLTHADLHHDNVLSSMTDEWIAIDPKGIAAAPIYETAAMIRNPYEKIRKMDNLEGLFKNRIKILSEELQFDPQLILKWCLAQTILSGVWSRDNAEYTHHALKVAKALNNLRVK